MATGIQNRKNWLQRTPVVCLCALLCTALWGSAFPCIKTGYQMFQIGPSDIASQILFAGIRFFFAGVMTLVFGSLLRRRLLIPHRGSARKILILSLFQTSLQYILFYIGLAHTTGVKGSILQGTSVLFSLVLVCFLFRTEKLTTLKLGGCIIGFAGIILVNFNGAGSAVRFHFIGEGFMILASLSSSFSAVFLKRFSEQEDPVTLSAWQFMAGGAMMTAAGALFGGRITGVTGPSVLLLAYMAFISAGAYTLWGILLKHNPVSRITIFGCMTQIFGVLFSSLILHEAGSIGIHAIVALILVSIGIFLVNFQRNI